MATKIVEKTTDEKNLDGGEVTQHQLDCLSENFFLRLEIFDHNGWRRMSAANPNDPDQSDTKVIHFPIPVVLDLFKKNPTATELLIYPGIHNDDLFPLPADRKDRYNNKLMVVLATATNNAPNLKLNDYVLIAGAGDGGGGQDNGKLCPPDKTC